MTTSISETTNEKCIQLQTLALSIYSHLGCKFGVGTQGENKNLSRKSLSCKLVVLMAITGANRISELQALDLRFWIFKTNRVLLKLASITKKRQLGAPLKEFLPVSLRTKHCAWCSV